VSNPPTGCDYDLMFSSRNVCLSDDGMFMYQFGIIDYLQDWNINKMCEHYAKTLILRKNAEGVSAVEPQLYSKRFYEFMSENVFTSQNNIKKMYA